MKARFSENKTGIYCFLIIVCAAGFIFNYQASSPGLKDFIVFLPFLAGALAFFLQTALDKKPFIELYSKSYPYRRLKLYGWISTFILFEFILVWGLSTRQISFQGEDLISVNILLFGAVMFYHLFVRMKISLRFLFMGILIPILAAGTTLGMANYFNIIEFIVPTSKIGNIVFLNSLYWMIYAIFFQVVCEEPAFRGYLLQKLLYKGEFSAVLLSSLCYGLWRVSFFAFAGRGIDEIVVVFIGNCIAGAMFAILFLKGRNLLVAALCHGILHGMWKSIFALSDNPGIGQYIKLNSPGSGIQIMILWYSCLLAGLILLTFIPRKKLCAD
jgi:membrane protease YdiL (CAAX protease family)